MRRRGSTWASSSRRTSARCRRSRRCAQGARAGREPQGCLAGAGGELHQRERPQCGVRGDRTLDRRQRKVPRGGAACGCGAGACHCSYGPRPKRQRIVAQHLGFGGEKHTRLTKLLIAMVQSGGESGEIDAGRPGRARVIFNSSEDYDKAVDCFPPLRSRCVRRTGCCTTDSVRRCPTRGEVPRRFSTTTMRSTCSPNSCAATSICPSRASTSRVPGCGRAHLHGAYAAAGRSRNARNGSVGRVAPRAEACGRRSESHSSS